MAVIVTPVSCAQRSIVVKICCSAADRSLVSVRRDHSFQRLRRIWSRVIRRRPSSTCSLSLAMRLARAVQVFTRGFSTSRSPANKPIAVSARITSNCWRFLVGTFPSLSPMKTETELQGR